ncbi:MAG TPA: hypothetical protein VGC85_02895 [Chthoniobacterales bacterium]
MKVLNVVLLHQRAEDVPLILKRWDKVCRKTDLLLAYGGTTENFDAIAHRPKIFIADQRLRVRDNQREYQSVTGIYKGATEWLKADGSGYNFVYFAEFDHMPLVTDLNQRQITRLEEVKADALVHNLQRIDATNHPHYLYHASNPRFHDHFAQISVRTDKEVILSMLGTGSFWRRAAFEGIGSYDEPFPIYNEVYIPTLAHHLGFRLRDWAEQNSFVRHLGDFAGAVEEARRSGAWTVHPIKRLLAPDFRDA